MVGRFVAVWVTVVATVGAAGARAATVAGTGVTSDGTVLEHAAQIRTWAAELITLRRDADGAVVVTSEPPDLTATGTCTAEKGTGVARCPASTRIATVAPLSSLASAPIRVVVEPGAGLRVAVFGGTGDDAIDLRGAIASQVSCGGGFDTVLASLPWIWDDCELVNSAAYQPRTVLGTVRNDELDAAPGGLGWVDRAGRLHLRVTVAGPERVLLPRRSTLFRRLDLGLDRRGRPVATVGECRSAARCERWLSVDVRTGRRSPLRLPVPAGCQVGWAARWRTRTALGVQCRAPSRTTVVIAGPGPPRRVSFAYPDGAWAPLVDLRGDVVTADYQSGGAGGVMWALWIGPHGCRWGPSVTSEGPESGSAASRVRIVAGNRLLWSSVEWSGVSEMSIGTIATVEPGCHGTSSHILEGAMSSAATLVGSTLIRSTLGQLTTQRLQTAPESSLGTYPIAAPTQVFGY